MKAFCDDGLCVWSGEGGKRFFEGMTSVKGERVVLAE